MGDKSAAPVTGKSSPASKGAPASFLFSKGGKRFHHDMVDDLWKPEHRRSYRAPRIGGERDWDLLPWSDDFVDITGEDGPQPRFRTRVKMAWDDEYFHVRAWLEEPHVWGTIKEKNAVIFNDNDFEVFIDPDCDSLNYYEFEMNALGTIWELSLPKPYREGGKPILGCNMKGLRKKVIVHGSLNNPEIEDESWEAHLSFPWAELAQYHRAGPCPPLVGDRWRVNFSRVQWRHLIREGKYERIPPHGTDLSSSLNPEEQEHPEDNWVWSPQGVVNMHLPRRWGEVTFG